MKTGQTPSKSNHDNKNEPKPQSPRPRKKSKDRATLESLSKATTNTPDLMYRLPTLFHKILIHTGKRIMNNAVTMNRTWVTSDTVSNQGSHNEEY